MSDWQSRYSNVNKDNGPMRVPYRAWINQPSTQQPLHKLHGKNVIVTAIDGDTAEVFFTEGGTISSRIPKLVLSKGWNKA